jgi:hypothetical protein
MLNPSIKDTRAIGVDDHNSVVAVIGDSGNESILLVVGEFATVTTLTGVRIEEDQADSGVESIVFDRG